MRVGLAALAVLTGLVAAAQAQGPGERVELARYCERGADWRVRLESVEQASAVVECQVDAAGAPSACAVTFASPNVDTVRAIALSQMCYGRRADAALVSTGADGTPAARFNFEFNVSCSRAHGSQVCATSRLRARQIGAEPETGD